MLRASNQGVSGSVKPEPQPCGPSTARPSPLPCSLRSGGKVLAASSGFQLPVPMGKGALKENWEGIGAVHQASRRRRGDTAAGHEHREEGATGILRTFQEARRSPEQG